MLAEDGLLDRSAIVAYYLDDFADTALDEATFEPGTIWTYNDKNTDILMMLAGQVTGRSLPDLLSDLFAEFGAHAPGSIALTSDGTAAPSHGLSKTLMDYGLFHQWIAEGKAPAGYYASLRDSEKT